MNISDSEYSQLASCIKIITLDAILNSDSGHPGAALGLSDIATVLYKDFLQFDPKNPNWKDRDRVVLSNGHASMLLYSLLYLTGYQDIDLELIKTFRKLNSRCQGHPEYKTISGIETTTGPLGQGIANSVGLALAAKISNAKHKVYCFVGDGCLMEGISQEAITLASHYNLDNLILIFDNNNITIDGKTDLSTSENQSARFNAAGFQVIEIDGHNYSQIYRAFQEASHPSKKPIFINAKTIIGNGIEGAGSSKMHGNVVPKDVIDKFKKDNSLPLEKFNIPNNLLTQWRSFGKRYTNNEVSNHAVLEVKMQTNFDTKINSSTRKEFSQFLKNIELDKNFVFGSADLASSTLIKTANMQNISSKGNYSGKYINFGIREHAMAGICNGIALYGNAIPLCSTFLAFSDYMKPAIRMAAIMHIKNIFIFTHDSIGVGEDGATHQPIEQITSLRATPNLLLIRPYNGIEIMEYFNIAIKHNGPAAFVLSRQEFMQHNIKSDSCNLGGYIIYGNHIKPKIVIVATGSEVEIALNVAQALYKLEINVISMPCISIFEQQDNEYKSKILPEYACKIGIEASDAIHLKALLGLSAKIFCVNQFGESGKASQLYNKFGIKKENIIDYIERL